MLGAEEEFLNDQENAEEQTRFDNYAEARRAAVNMANRYKSDVAIRQRETQGPQAIRSFGHWMYDIYLWGEDRGLGGVVSVVKPGAPLAWSIDGPVR